MLFFTPRYAHLIIIRNARIVLTNKWAATNLTDPRSVGVCCQSKQRMLELFSDIYFDNSGKTSVGMWWTVFGVILIATAATRFYKLDQPDHIW